MTCHPYKKVTQHGNKVGHSKRCNVFPRYFFRYICLYLIIKVYSIQVNIGYPYGNVAGLLGELKIVLNLCYTRNMHC